MSLIERGRRVPSLDVVQRIASTVGLSVHTLVLLACDDADFKDAEDRASALKLLERVGVEGRQAS